MKDFSTLVAAYWWLWIWPVFGAVEWVADQFNAGIGAIAKRRARKIGHQEELRQIELERARRQLEAAHPAPVKPICGCTHDVAFHNRSTGACHGETGRGKNVRQCTCQGYSGPTPLSQIYADPLTDLDTTATTQPTP